MVLIYTARSSLSPCESIKIPHESTQNLYLCRLSLPLSNHAKFVRIHVDSQWIHMESSKCVKLYILCTFTDT